MGGRDISCGAGDAKAWVIGPMDIAFVHHITNEVVDIVSKGRH
jgi:hypothetical protein